MSIPQIALLTYDAAVEWLSGTINSNEPPFEMKAYSGGSRGHLKRHKSDASDYLYAEAATIRSHFATTKEVKDRRGHYLQRGGTLPPGHYDCKYLKSYESFGECIRLVPQSDARRILISPALALKFHKTSFYPERGGFYIHGNGPKGSDGCIVPDSPAERRRLNKAVRDFQGEVVLFVKNVSFELPPEVGGGLVNWWEVAR